MEKFIEFGFKKFDLQGYLRPVFWTSNFDWCLCEREIDGNIYVELTHYYEEKSAMSIQRNRTKTVLFRDFDEAWNWWLVNYD